MKNILKNKYKIGDWVEVSTTVKFYYEQDGNSTEFFRRAKRIPITPFVGQIVGAKIKYLGKLNSSTSFSYEEYEPERGFLEVDSSITLWIVTNGMINKQVVSFDQDVVLVDPAGRKLPWSNNGQQKWNEEDRFNNQRLIKELKEFAKAAPRDAKGRFIPIRLP